MTRTAFLAALALLSAPTVALAQGTMAPDMSHGGTVMGHTQGSDAAYQEANQAMMKNMAMATTGNADQDFVAMMIPHHQGAIDMAKVELKYGKDPKLRAMAEKIISDQEAEIAQMREWQKKNPR